MEVHKAELFYTDPNTKQNKSIIAEGKDEGDAAQIGRASCRERA